ncbi:MAG: hypothetical protein NTU94_15965, partial [Planctomycetota bacterium]|nr:hypothetical protein [Planctomycetota bacterium]
RCLTRAKMGEGMAPLIGLGPHAPELFLVGMFSVMDTLLNTPMPKIMAELPLADQIKEALLGGPNLYRRVLEAILCYEAGSWDAFSRHAAALRLDERRVLAVYTESLRWAQGAFGLMQACATA